jgi:hypothetical protein
VKSEASTKNGFHLKLIYTLSRENSPHQSYSLNYGLEFLTNLETQKVLCSHSNAPAKVCIALTAVLSIQCQKPLIESQPLLGDLFGDEHCVHLRLGLIYAYEFRSPGLSTVVSIQI